MLSWPSRVDGGCRVKVLQVLSSVMHWVLHPRIWMIASSTTMPKSGNGSAFEPVLQYMVMGRFVLYASFERYIVLDPKGVTLRSRPT